MEPSPNQRLELQRAASDICSPPGRIAREPRCSISARRRGHSSAAVCHAPPSSVFCCTPWLVVIRPTDSRSRAPDGRSTREPPRIDALYTAAMWASASSRAHGRVMQARYFIAAFRAGILPGASRRRLRDRAPDGSRKGFTKRERTLIDLWSRLAERHWDGRTVAFFGTALAPAFSSGGHGSTRASSSYVMEARLPGRSRGALIPGSIFATYTYFLHCDLRENARRIARLCARGRGPGRPLYTVTLRTARRRARASPRTTGSGRAPWRAMRLAQWHELGYLRPARAGLSTRATSLSSTRST